MTQKISFLSDNFILQGVLHLPDTPNPPVVFGSHGLFSDKESPKQIELAKQCKQFGIAFFRFDHRGCGESDGDHRDVPSIKARCIDLTSAVKTVLARDDTGDRIGFFGSSMGGAVSLAVAGDLQPKAIVTFAAPLRNHSMVEVPVQEESDSAAPIYKTGFKFDISGSLSNLHSILIFHGDADDVVPLSNARKIYSIASDPKKIVIQKNGDHRMSDPDHQKEFVSKAAEWFRDRLIH